MLKMNPQPAHSAIFKGLSPLGARFSHGFGPETTFPYPESLKPVDCIRAEDEEDRENWYWVVENEFKELGGITVKNVDPDKILEGAMKKLTTVIVIGEEASGELYVATSNADVGDLILFMERVKKRILDTFDT